LSHTRECGTSTAPIRGVGCLKLESSTFQHDKILILDVCLKASYRSAGSISKASLPLTRKLSAHILVQRVFVEIIAPASMTAVRELQKHTIVGARKLVSNRERAGKLPATHGQAWISAMISASNHPLCRRKAAVSQGFEIGTF
jgi:hypothetical protein